MKTREGDLQLCVFFALVFVHIGYQKKYSNLNNLLTVRCEPHCLTVCNQIWLIKSPLSYVKHSVHNVLSREIL